MATQKPSVGRIVHVPVDPATNNGAAIAPGIITRVWSESIVNVRVLHDSDAISWRTSAIYRDSFDDIEGAPAVWSWPERV
ncbi:hypothetical protein [Streptomyces gilvus]|uniref:hypothetical protein n=1 Tax=Streptomyces gilvus TaxID=2920937 RepID=UPI001F0F56BD|nr:hypothetical protein [Streptomyces sp. CME 23]MCH5677823.1 hypothetical protein [Streptomyces sp. CME 23]